MACLPPRKRFAVINFHSEPDGDRAPTPELVSEPVSQDEVNATVPPPPSPNVDSPCSSPPASISDHNDVDMDNMVLAQLCSVPDRSALHEAHAVDSELPIASAEVEHSSTSDTFDSAVLALAGMHAPTKKVRPLPLRRPPSSAAHDPARDEAPLTRGPRGAAVFGMRHGRDAQVAPRRDHVQRVRPAPHQQEEVDRQARPSAANGASPRSCLLTSHRHSATAMLLRAMATVC
jgi:hypothetical protein